MPNDFSAGDVHVGHGPRGLHRLRCKWLILQKCTPMRIVYVNREGDSGLNLTPWKFIGSFNLLFDGDIVSARVSNEEQGAIL